MNAKIFFETLSSSKVEYAVMRNICNLPDINDTDLDLYVSENDKCKFKEVLLKLTHQGFYHILKGTSGRDFESYMIFDANSKKITGFRLDVNYGIYFRGQRLLNRDIENEIIENDKFLHFSSSVALLCIWLKCFVNSEPVKQDVWQETKDMLLSNRELIEEWSGLLAPSFSEQHRFLEFILIHIRQNNYSTFNEPKFKLNFAQRVFSFYEKSKRFARPGGLWIAFVGVDGTGKSTFIHTCEKSLMNPTHGKISVYHFRPKLLPARSNKAIPNVVSDTEVNTASLAKLLKGHFKLLYLFTDYFLGYLFKVRVELAGRGGVVIFDRYALDLLYDPTRINLTKLGYFWTRIWKLLPKPDATFAILAEPNNVLERKQERSEVEIAQLQQNLNQLIQQDVKYHAINNDADFATSYEMFSETFMSVVSTKGLR